MSMFLTGKVKYVTYGAISLIVGGSLLFVYSLIQPPRTEAPDLGFAYITVTPGMSDYYYLGVDRGALITQVSPGGVAERAGLRTGDVILSFNNVAIQDDAPLLGLLRKCQAGNTITVQILRDKNVINEVFVHPQ